MSDRRSAISGGMGAPSGFPVERGLSYGRFGEASSSGMMPGCDSRRLSGLCMLNFTSDDTGMDYREIITIEPGKRGGRPCVRGMRIAVSDVLGWLAAGMSHAEILADFPELTENDIRACLAYAADRERRLTAAK
jgi:uncharacterized protein (DUF433 family)